MAARTVTPTSTRPVGTAAAAGAAAGAVSLGVIRAQIDKALAAKYVEGVLGISAPAAAAIAATFEHKGQRVDVVPCPSALAVREALLAQTPGTWLVIVTDRPDEDLGAGILAHLVGNRLRNPDPWDAVRQRFRAMGAEPSLMAGPDRVAIANGLLRATPAGDPGWPPAPAGVLSRDHALGSVAAEHLGLNDRTVDVLSVLAWMSTPGTAGRIGELRALAGDDLTDATLVWVAEAAGVAGPAVRPLLQAGTPGDGVPLGLALSALEEAIALADGEVQIHASMALAQLEQMCFGDRLPSAAREALGSAAEAVIGEQLAAPRTQPSALAALARADVLLRSVKAESFGTRSTFLPSGLTGRLHALAETLRVAVPTGLSAVEDAWQSVQRHHLASVVGSKEPDARLAPFAAAVRLARWLATPDASAVSIESEGLAGLAQRHAGQDAWVDQAVNDAATGVADQAMATALAAVLDRARERRDRHDVDFARALADATALDTDAGRGFLPASTGRVWLLEQVIGSVVAPIARTTNTLLLVLDGMSAGVATEIVDDVLARHDGWAEALLPGEEHRGCALAVLPTLTANSRTSLLVGELTTGTQVDERTGYVALIRALNLTSPEPFHKKPLDSTRPGFLLEDDINTAILSPSNQLVTCVLNTIDDALDRSDPGGTSWTLDAVKHLRPLLAAALAAGRTVIMTSDHGHVVERRQGTQRSLPPMTSARSRAAAPPAGPGEVLVSGRRVLATGSCAVLAVDERLRYGPLKAGYHGGASPAEVVVPLIVLSPSEAPSPDLRVAGPQEPSWWWPSSAPAATGVLPKAPLASGTAASSPTGLIAGTLFEDAAVALPVAETPRSRSGATGSSGASRLGHRVVESKVFAAQLKVAGRIAVTSDAVSTLVDALASAPGTRLTGQLIAAALGQHETRVAGALAQVQKLLNVEGYPVLTKEGATAILDVALLCEQFGVRP